MTTPREALNAMGDGNLIRVKTSSGIEYRVERDVIEAVSDEADCGFGYVYGYRVDAGGTHARRVFADSIAWFDLRNVTIIS